MTIKLDKASIQKGDTSLLDSIDFEIQNGENWAILGGNGAGKSTLLHALTGSFYPTKGRIEKSADGSIESLANNFQSNRLVSSAYQYYQQRYNAADVEIAPTVYEVVQNQVKPLFTSNADSYQLPPKPYSDSEIENCANLLKINYLLSKKIVTLSNGETRRIHLLMALLKKPQMLLLDNPFIGLDVESRQILQKILNDIIASGIQIVLVCAAVEIPDGITNAVLLKAGKVEKILRGSFLTDFKQKTLDTAVQVLDKNILTQLTASPDLNNFKYAVRFRNTTVQYGSEKVVNNINWDIKKGEKWALLGANGSGKSTLLSLITADNPQAYGNDYDLFDRKRGTGESIWDIKKRIGFVSPELQLYTNAKYSVAQVVAAGLFDAIQLYKALTETETGIVHTYLDLLGLKNDRHKLLHQLSSGEQRRVFLARALVKNPPLLILDEPCQGLDHTNMVYFRDLVNELVVSLDKTLIYVTHYATEVPACVNQVFKIEKGKRIV